MEFSIKDFFSKCDQIRSFLRIWSHLLKKYLMENFIFCAVDKVAFRATLKPGICYDSLQLLDFTTVAFRATEILSTVGIDIPVDRNL